MNIEQGIMNFEVNTSNISTSSLGVPCSLFDIFYLHEDI